MPTLGEGDLPTDATGHPYTAGQGLVVNGSTTYGRLGSDLVSLYLGETKVSPDPPGAPTLLSATFSGGTTTLAFSAPTDDGGLNISEYHYYFNGSQEAADNVSLGSTNVALFLSDRTGQSATIVAVNGVGQSNPSNAVTVT